MGNIRYWVLIVLLFGALPSLTWSGEKVASGYKLGPGDEIKVIVFDEPDLSLEFNLTDAGTISYPFLGEVRVKGMTASELEVFLANHLKQGYLIDPKVNVRVLKYRQFYINGEVEKPGGYTFQPGLTVQMAVALAGGFTERASKRSIYVIHEEDKAHDKRDIGLNDEVQPGDIVMVEESFF